MNTISNGNWYIWYPMLLHMKQKNRIFQYKLVKDVLHLNKKLFHFGTISQSTCSFCELFDESSQHFFYECTNGQNLSPSIISFRKSCIISFSKKSIFGFTDVLDNNYLLVNHLFLIFKYNVWNLKVSNTLSFQSLKRLISQIKYLEETTIENDLNKKWKVLSK